MKRENGNRATTPSDIDVVAISDIDKKAVIGECKFKNEKIDKDVFETLKLRAKHINAKYEIAKCLFFSLAGYTKWVRDNKGENDILMTLEEMYE